MIMARRLERFEDMASMSDAAARMIAERVRPGPTRPLDLSAGSVSRRPVSRAAAPASPCSICLSGGSTPRGLFALLGSRWRDALPWERVHLFWSDERFVPVGHPDNNYGMAKALFIGDVPIPASNVHPIPTDRPDSVAADVYEGELRSFFLGEAVPGTGEGFDLAFLGIGEDGHTASLFPGWAAPADRWVAAVEGPASRPPRVRITLTSAVLDRAETVVFLVAGANKREALRRVLEDDPSMPAARIRGRRETIIFADVEACPL